MPDNWGYVVAAYGLAAVVLAVYWRHLARRERALTALDGRPRGRRDERSHAPTAGHPRQEPGARTPSR